MIDRILSHIKAAAIHFANWLTLTFEPYRPFTRAAYVRDTLPLKTKAEQFNQDLHARFKIREGTIINYRIPLPVGSPLDLGDQAIWHGIYSASEAFQYALAQDNSDILFACLKGLADQQPAGLLVRGLDEAGRVQFDVSNDSATGHLAGLHFIWKYGNADHKAAAKSLMAAWAQQIIDHNFALVNPDGQPTPYGQLADGWKTDPLRASLLVAILKAAYNMTGDSAFYSVWCVMSHKFGPMIPFAKARLFSLDTHYDTHRAAIHLHILADLDSKDGTVRYGLDQMATVARKQGNIWVLTLAGAINGYAAADRDLALKVLSEFSIEIKGDDAPRRLSADPTIPKLTYGGQFVGREPPAKSRKTSRDFTWQDHPYSLDAAGKPGDPPGSYLNGGDFLAAYRLARLTGLITDKD